MAGGRDADVLVVGAGVVGSALAMHLAERGVVTQVVDPDLAGPLSSSERNAGGVRATWWRPVNVRLCAASIDFFAAHAEELGFRQRGYLWMYPPELWDGARAHVDLQNAHGRGVELLSPAELMRRYPVIDRPDGIAGATFSPHDGILSPDALRGLYRRRARAAGALFRDRRLVTAVAGDAGRLAVTCRVLPDEGAARDALGPEGVAGAAGPVERVVCARLVNAAGAWAGRVAALDGVRSPAFAVPRQISLLRCRDVDLSALGMLVDTTGVYFHHESGDLVLAGYSPEGDAPGYGMHPEGRAFFEREIWPRLAARISGFDQSEYAGGWAGLYDMSPDRSALVGPVPGRPGRFACHSFSGRGVMQSHGAAAALAELIATGRYGALDASDLDPGRFAGGRLQPEELHI